MKNKITLITFALIILLILIWTSTVDATTNVISKGNYYIYSAINDNYAIDLKGNKVKNKSNIQLYKSNLSKAQLWKITPLNNGYYKISTINDNNYVMDVYGGRKTKGTNVQLYKFNNTKAQQWSIKSTGNGKFTITSRCNKLLLDVKSGLAKSNQNIQVNKSNNSKAQQFYIVPEVNTNNSASIKTGTYLISSILKDNYVIRLKEAKTKNKNNVIMSDYNYSINEYWYIEQLSNNFYKISTARDHNYSLDLSKGNKNSGANIQLYKFNRSPNQQFKIIKNKDNTYTFINRTNALAIDIVGQKKEKGTNVQSYRSNNTNAQKFKLVKENDTYNSESKEIALNNINTKAKKLMIVAHPDDETLWGSHGLYNDKYLVVCITCGKTRLDRVYEYKAIMSKAKDDYMMLGFPDLENGQKSNWSNVKSEIISELNTIISAKNWEEIVTYNPDGVTGHIHHKMTSEYVTDIVVKKNNQNKLYYFGRYYSDNDTIIPEIDKRYYLNNNEYNFKTKILYPLYETQAGVLDYFNKMTRYESWLTYNEWYN